MTNSDSFSWRRCLAYGRMYSPLIKYQLILWPLVALAIFLLSFASGFISFGIIFIGLLGFLASFMVYFGPMVFAFGPDLSVETILPVKWSEKAVFVIVYSLILLPLCVKLPIAGGVLIAQSISPELVQTNSYIEVQRFSMSTYGWWGMVQELIPAAVCLLAVVMYSRRRVLMATVWTFVSFFGMGIIGFVVGLLSVFRMGCNDGMEGVGRKSPDEIVTSMMHSMSPYFIILSIVAAAFIVTVVCLICRRFKNRQI